MLDFFKLTFTNEVSVMLLAMIFMFFLILFLIIILFQKSETKKARNNMKIDLITSQEVIFTHASELLAKQLAEYTDTILVEKVNGYYNALVKNELFPAISEAAKKIAQLSEDVTMRQESGMQELAVMLANLFSVKMNEYIREEANNITLIQQSTVEFANELSRITESVKDLSALYTNANEQSNAISTSVSEVVSVLSNKILEFGGMLDSAANTVSEMQTHINESSTLLLGYNETTAQAQKIAIDSTDKLSEQSEKTAVLLNNAVLSMKQNTETAAKAVLSEFSTSLNFTTDTITKTVETLKDISENINSSANQFSSSITNIYKDFGSDLDKNLNNITSSITQSVNVEYQKVVMNAEVYSNQFENNITSLNTTLDGHMKNLQSISQMLNDNLSSFKMDVDTSSNRFELGMEKTVSEALTQMDNSLAEIVKRLVSVTKNIQEAADALPRAVRAVNLNEK